VKVTAMVTGLLALAACSGDPVPPNRVDNRTDKAIANAAPGAQPGDRRQ
jgi:hypothetical protein